jgi:hypothetical protein
MSLLAITSSRTYKGHIIEVVESPIQVFYVVDGNRAAAFWSIADCRRHINGQPTASLPVDIRNI